MEIRSTEYNQKRKKMGVGRHLKTNYNSSMLAVFFQTIKGKAQQLISESNVLQRYTKVRKD